MPKPTQPATRLWSPRSVAVLVLAWLILQIGGLFSPGLLDDVDSIYIEIAREMLRRHDFVTPYIDGIRFFDKPPLMYWMASASMAVFGIKDWSARLPLALCVLALLLATYALGIRLFRGISPARHPDRGGFYAALALATSIGPYLYTRFYIPDILLALWMTLAVHLFLIALNRVEDRAQPHNRVAHPLWLSTKGGLFARMREPLSSPTRKDHLSTEAAHSITVSSERKKPASLPQTLAVIHKSPLLPCLAFAAVMALNVLTKGLIGLVFPIAFVLLYLAITRRLPLLLKLHPVASAAVFLAIAAPWHVLAALRNPAIPLPPGLGLPAKGGWAWFYLYNEHIARFLSKRIPHDYGQTPVWLFWLYVAIWIMPWTAFLPSAMAHHLRTLRSTYTSKLINKHGLGKSRATSPGAPCPALGTWAPHQQEAALALLLWAAIVLLFFSLSARQEYYSLPAIPALALMAGALLARADTCSKLNQSSPPSDPENNRHFDRSSSFLAAERRNPLLYRRSPSPHAGPAQSALRWHLFFLHPLTTLIAIVCAWFAFTAPHPPPGTDLSTLLAANPEFYNLSLGHIFDLTGAAMGLFRGPLAAVAVGMLAIGPVSYLLRRANRTYAANLTLAAAMTVTLLAAHEGLARFYPILGSKSLAEAIDHARQVNPRPADLILLDGELTSGSTLIFYTGQQVHLLNGRVNGLWYGSFWSDAPAVFESEASLRRLWAGPRRIFLFTYNPAGRTRELTPYAPVHTLAAAGGKTILTNH